MQDGKAPPDGAEGKDDPVSGVVLSWKTGPPLGKAQRARLLEILFGPDENAEAA